MKNFGGNRKGCLSQKLFEMEQFEESEKVLSFQISAILYFDGN